MAIVSLVVMMYYSVEFSKYTQMGMNYVNLLKNQSLSSIHWTGVTRVMKMKNEIGTAWNTSQVVYFPTSALSIELGLEGNVTPKQPTKSTKNLQEAFSTVPTSATAKNLSLCASGSKQVGSLYVDKTVPKMEDVEKQFSNSFGGTIFKGGYWKPGNCQARVKMALIIPFRDRYEQLSIFVHHIHPMLNRQNLEYRIFVIEEAGDTRFNRAMLFNIGFKEALKFDHFECFIFHDVDLIPENDRNEYSCPSSPRHMSVAVDKFNYILPYTNIFGGVGAFTRQHFELINGFSNKFWGWGGEDDDLFKRISAKGLKLTRPSMQLGRYTMIRLFHKSAKPDEQRFEKLRDSSQRMNHDGLNSLKYTVESITEHLLYTLVTVNLEEAFKTNLR